MARTRSHEHPDIDARLSHFTEACRQRGTPVTHQRLAIFRALLKSESHPDAEALHRSLRGTHPNADAHAIWLRRLLFHAHAGYRSQ